MLRKRQTSGFWRDWLLPFEVAHLCLSQPDASARDCVFAFRQCLQESLADASGYDDSHCLYTLDQPLRRKAQLQKAIAAGKSQKNKGKTPAASASRLSVTRQTGVSRGPQARIECRAEDGVEQWRPELPFFIHFASFCPGLLRPCVSHPKLLRQRM